MYYPKQQGKSREGIPRNHLHFGLALLLAAVVLPLAAAAAIMAGIYSMARSAAPPLVNPMNVQAGVANYGFCSKVGGIAFGGEAESADGSIVERLTYRHDRPDGQRLEAIVRLGTRRTTVTLPVYDWEFVPAARFAKGAQHALVTYFGTLSDPEEQERLRKQDCKFINYHEMVDNTLAGFRLMQADLLAFHEIAPHNPEENGSPIRGPGEVLGSVEANKIANQPVQDYWRVTAKEEHSARSYVICDVGQTISFRLENQGTKPELVITGDPYWSCWKACDPIEIFGEISKAFSGTLSVEERNRPPSLEIVSRFELFMKQKGLQLAERMNEENFRQLPEVSRDLSRLMKQQEGGNPPVYRALTKFMRCAALFRHLKRSSPEKYTEFVSSLDKVELRPAVETPTVIYPPE